MITYGVDSPAILGVMEIGVFLSLVMFGVEALQGYFYFQNCRSDRAGLKLLVRA
jgi:1,4-dihydroxy-2-naphthoate octaprenyltransferase